MNSTIIDPGRGPSDLELYPVTAQYFIKAEKRNTENNNNKNQPQKYAYKSNQVSIFQ